MPACYLVLRAKINFCRSFFLFPLFSDNAAISGYLCVLILTNSCLHSGFISPNNVVIP